MSIDYWLGFLSVPVLIIFVICKLVQGAIDEKDRKDMLKKLIEDNKWSIEYYNNLLNDSHYYLTDSEKLTYKRHIKSYKLDNRSLRNEIRSLKDRITA